MQIWQITSKLSDQFYSECRLRNASGWFGGIFREAVEREFVRRRWMGRVEVGDCFLVGTVSGGEEKMIEQ